MKPAYIRTATAEVLFGSADHVHSTLRKRLVGDAALTMTQSEVERLVEVEGPELLRTLPMRTGWTSG